MSPPPPAADTASGTVPGTATLRKNITPSTMGKDSSAAGPSVAPAALETEEESSSSLSGSKKRKRRGYDMTNSNIIRGWWTVMGSGSYATGGDFVCMWCKKTKMQLPRGFHITNARTHIESCTKASAEAKQFCEATRANAIKSAHGLERVEKIKAVAAANGGFDPEITTPACIFLKPTAMQKYSRPNHQRSFLPDIRGYWIIQCRIEELLSYFDSPVRVRSRYSKQSLLASCGTGIKKFIPSTQKELVKVIDDEAFEHMVTMLELQPGNLTVGFDGVTALGKHVTLYTFSKGIKSLFVTLS